MLEPIFNPTNRASQHPGCQSDQRNIGIDRGFYAVGATNISRHAQAQLVSTHLQGLCHHCMQGEGTMEIRPNSVVTSTGGVVCYDTIRFYRRCCYLGKFKATANDMRCIFQRLLPFSIGEDAVIGDITAHGLVQGSAFWTSCSFGIHNGWQEVIFDLDEFRGILSDITSIRHDYRYRLASKAHLVDCQRIILYWLRHSYREGSHLPSHISPGNHAYHPWNLKGCLRVNAAYESVCIWASDNSSNFTAGERVQVVYVAACPSHQAFILYPGDRLSNPAKLFYFHNLCSLDRSFLQ